MTQSDIACNIRAIATAKGKTYRCIAKEAVFSPQMISDMLAGRKIIRAEYLPQIAKSLGVPISRLFEDNRPTRER